MANDTRKQLSDILFDHLGEHVSPGCWMVKEMPGDKYLVLCNETPASVELATNDVEDALRGTTLEGKVTIFFHKGGRQ